jgi:GT2 family glycosyltransferase
MISIVVCSVNEEMFRQFSRSVAATIGVPHEIVRIDNRTNQYAICDAYNKGTELCRHDLICFVHEDIIFESQDWGKALLHAFSDPYVGLAGLLGTCYFSLFPTNWLNQHEFEGQWRGPTHNDMVRRHVRFGGSNIAEVAAVDGMFLATTKQVLHQFKFSADLLKGFHGYDMDFSLQVRQKYKVVVARDIIVLHLSGGVFNEAYYNTMELLAKKWHAHLPAYVPAYTREELRALKLLSLQHYFNDPANRGWRRKLNGWRYALRHGVLLSWLRQTIMPAPKRAAAYRPAGAAIAQAGALQTTQSPAATES